MLSWYQGVFKGTRIAPQGATHSDMEASDITDLVDLLSLEQQGHIRGSALEYVLGLTGDRCVCVCVRRTHAQVCACPRPRPWMCVYACVRACVRACVHACVRACVHARVFRAARSKVHTSCRGRFPVLPASAIRGVHTCVHARVCDMCICICVRTRVCVCARARDALLNTCRCTLHCRIARVSVANAGSQAQIFSSNTLRSSR